MTDLLIIFSAIADIIFGVLLLNNNRKNVVNQTFALYTFITGLWMVSTIFLSRFPSLLTGTFTISLGMCLGVAFFMFIKEYPRSDKTGNFRFYLPIIIPVIIIIIGNFSKLLLTDVKIVEGVAQPVFGPLFFLLEIYVFAILPYGIYKLIKNYRSADSVERLKMKYLIITLFGFIGSLSIFNGLLPAMGILHFVNFGITSTVFWTFILFYSISRNRLFGLRYFFGRFLDIIIRVISAFLIINGLILFEQNYLEGVFSNAAIILNLIIILIATIYSSKIYFKVSDFIYNKLVNSHFNPVTIKQSLSKRLSRELNLENILSIFLKTIDGSLMPNGIGIYLFNIPENKLIKADSVNMQPVEINYLQEFLALVRNYDLFQTFSKENDQMLNFHLDDVKKLHEFMLKYNLDLLIPVRITNDVSGVVLIGYQTNSVSFTKETIDLIESLIENLALSLEKSLLYEELQNFNKNLERKVSEATIEITKQKDEIQEALKNERNMIDILGHELRTPLSIAKNAVYLMSDLKDQNKLTPEKTEKYVSMSKENLARESRLLETMLSTTKIDNQKLELNFEKVDLIDVFNDTLDGLKVKADKKGLQIIFAKPAEAFIYADRTRIQEITDNLIDNAIKYTEKGSITISIIPHAEFVTFSVKDTGSGIPQDEIGKIGNKFYRVNTYLNSSKSSDYNIVRPGGTGLGLYVTYNLVKMMQGTITVESEVGQGTEFTVKMPTYHGQKSSPQGTRTLDKIQELKMRQAKLAESKQNSANTANGESAQSSQQPPP